AGIAWRERHRAHGECRHVVREGDPGGSSVDARPDAAVASTHQPVPKVVRVDGDAGHAPAGEASPVRPRVRWIAGIYQGRRTDTDPLTLSRNDGQRQLV